MAVRQSKAALAEAARLLGTDRPAARTYMRRVQAIAGPVPYEVICNAMRATGTHEVKAVARSIIGDRPGTES